nr:MAG TPA: hypothetical protein [Caudoviricetes sp.]DAT88253.1 MAG TPA: hypothetical protein [Caudoviricetes sp.]
MMDVPRKGRGATIYGRRLCSSERRGLLPPP